MYWNQAIFKLLLPFLSGHCEVLRAAGKAYGSVLVLPLVWKNFVDKHYKHEKGLVLFPLKASAKRCFTFCLSLKSDHAEVNQIWHLTNFELELANFPFSSQPPSSCQPAIADKIV